jgi:hypothetical protein
VKQWDKCINVGGDYVEKQPTNAPFWPHRCVSCPCRLLQMMDHRAKLSTARRKKYPVLVS